MTKINIKSIRPMANYLVTTKDVYTAADNANSSFIANIEGSLKEYQKVVAVGPVVRNINVGDIVRINPKRYAQYKHQAGSLKDGVIEDNPVITYRFNMVELNHIQHLLLTDQDIDFVIENYEEEPDAPSIIIPDNKIILN